jgi:hypothetical protein
MSTIAPPTGELLYEYHATFNAITEFGVSLATLAAGRIPAPPEGARFDVGWEGVCVGPRLTGKVAGVDYLDVRADGRMQLHLHAVITADTGERIAFFADGVALPRAGSSIADVRENVTLRTAYPAYRWVNAIQIWAVGIVDLAGQAIQVRGYVA